VSEDDKFIQAIHRIDKRVERIERVLLGDEEAEQDGLVQKVKYHSQYIENDKKIRNKILGGIAVGTPIFIIFWDKFLHIIGMK
tara:strand:- start:1359 stop:1607 length:249 start_codon:yes stop_codon:yes gene_type:complete